MERITGFSNFNYNIAWDFLRKGPAIIINCTLENEYVNLWLGNGGGREWSVYHCPVLSMARERLVVFGAMRVV